MNYIGASNCKELILAIRKEFPVCCSFCLQFQDFRAKICSNDYKLLNELRSYFKQFTTSEDVTIHCCITLHQGQVPNIPLDFESKPPEKDKKKIKEEFCKLANGKIVKKLASGIYFIFDREDFLAVGPCLEHTNQVVNFINQRFIEHKVNQGALLAHAAGVQKDGQGLAVAGNSGSGKSTLALQLLNYGFTFTSNDRLLLQQHPYGLRMLGVAKLPRINPGTALNNPKLQTLLPSAERSRLNSLPTQKLWELEDKYDVPIEDIYGQEKFFLNAPIDSLLFLNWSDKNAPLHLEKFCPRERLDLIEMLKKESDSFYCVNCKTCTEHSIANYCEILEQIRMYELSGGIDFERAVEICFQILKSNREDKTKDSLLLNP